MLLAGRVRKPQEELTIAEVLEKYFKRKVNPLELFSLNSRYVKDSIEKVSSASVCFKFIDLLHFLHLKIVTCW